MMGQNVIRRESISSYLYAFYCSTIKLLRLPQMTRVAATVLGILGLRNTFFGLGSPVAVQAVVEDLWKVVGHFGSWSLCLVSKLNKVNVVNNIAEDWMEPLRVDSFTASPPLELEPRAAPKLRLNLPFYGARQKLLARLYWDINNLAKGSCWSRGREKAVFFQQPPSKQPHIIFRQI